MATDLRIVLPNRPGSLVEALEAIASAGATVSGICGDLRPGERWGFLHVLVEDPDAARAGLDRAGFEITADHDVDVLEVEEGAGMIAAAARSYSEQGRNMEVIYMATDSRLVIGTEDMQKERPGVRMKDARY